MSVPNSFDRTNAVVGFAVWLLVLVVYWMTKAATLSFWDCGEFIAASYILGVPHPPGAPLYVMVGRLISIIPFHEDISARINALSSICNAFTALFGYLVAVRLVRRWVDADGSGYSRFLRYVGPAAGALLLAFGLTQWNNSIEAEVYAMSMMLFMAIVWLALIYIERRGTPAASRVMLLIVYLAALGIGVHMTTFLALPAVALLFVVREKAPAWVWFVLGGFVLYELYLVFALSSRPGEVAFWVPVAVVTALYLFYVLSFDRLSVPAVVMAGGLLLSLAPAVAVFGGPRTLLDGIGVASLVAVTLYAVYLLLGGRHGGSGDADVPAARVAAVLVCAAAGAALLISLDPLKGYNLFLWLTVLGAGVVAFLLRRHVHLPTAVGIAGALLVIIGVKPFVAGLVVSTVVILFLGLGLRMTGWKTALLIPFVTALGFSVNLYLPIRSAQQPAINENNPSESLQTTIGFLERKQYGSQSMVPRMFKRRGSWEHQFGMYQRMGFWRFFHEQWGLRGARFFLPFILGLFGIWEVVRRRPAAGVVFTVLLLLGSVGLVLYMNFADGTRQNPLTGGDYLEVRDRDYFFTPAFVLFGLAIGIGMSATAQFIREVTVKAARSVRMAASAAVLVLFLMPAYTMAENYYECDRSRNYIPYDYAWSMLNAADPNAVLFTAGDNDTFPLWCLQEVYGVRRDVINVNLSLANTHWYIQQLQEIHGLDLGWTNEEIRRLRPFRLPDGRTLRVQDQVIDRIIDRNAAGRPINFSITVSAGSRKYHGYLIDSMLELSGLQFRWHDTAIGGLVVNIEQTLDFFDDSTRFRMRGIEDPTIYKDPATLRVATNVGSSLLTVADTLRAAREYERAEAVVRRTLRQFPFMPSALYLLVDLWADQGKVEEIQAMIDTVTWRDRFRGTIDSLQLRVAVARAWRRRDRSDEAERLLKDILSRHTSYRRAFDELMRIYVQAGDYGKARETLRWWVTRNPGDRRMQEALRRLEAPVPDSSKQ